MEVDAGYVLGEAGGLLVHGRRDEIRIEEAFLIQHVEVGDVVLVRALHVTEAHFAFLVGLEMDRRIFVEVEAEHGAEGFLEVGFLDRQGYLVLLSVLVRVLVAEGPEHVGELVEGSRLLEAEGGEPLLVDHEAGLIVHPEAELRDIVHLAFGGGEARLDAGIGARLGVELLHVDPVLLVEGVDGDEEASHDVLHRGVLVRQEDDVGQVGAGRQPRP